MVHYRKILKKRSIKSLAAFCAFPILVGCLSAKTRILTAPEAASVFIETRMLSGKTQTIKLGVTPLLLSTDELEAKIETIPDSSNGLLQLRFDKQGFDPLVYVLDWDNFNNHELSVELTETRTNKNENYEKKARHHSNPHVEEISTAVQSVKEIYNLRTQNKLQEATRLTQSLTVRFPEVAMFWEILGSLAIIQNEPILARNAYTESLRLEPNNQATRQALMRLNETLK